MPTPILAPCPFCGMTKLVVRATYPEGVNPRAMKKMASTHRRKHVPPQPDGYEVACWPCGARLAARCAPDVPRDRTRRALAALWNLRYRVDDHHNSTGFRACPLCGSRNVRQTYEAAVCVACGLTVVPRNPLGIPGEPHTTWNARHAPRYDPPPAPRAVDTEFLNYSIFDSHNGSAPSPLAYTKDELLRGLDGLCVDVEGLLGSPPRPRIIPPPPQDDF